MARKRTTVTFDADDLLDKYQVYDQAVDVVSCYQWLFAKVSELAATVRHFERYPRIPVGTKNLTPDFTVSFVDGSALVGEIARFARTDESIEGVCSQLQGYSSLAQVPDVPNRHGRQFTPAEPVDVAFLTHMRLAKSAAQHIFRERLDEPEHSFKPTRRPVLIEFSQDKDEYVFVLYPEGNGALHRGTRDHVYGDKEPFVCRPSQFDRIKIQFGFVNDPVAPLYMATRLWLRVFPTSFWDADRQEVTIPLAELVDAVHEQHEGKGTVEEVRRGMEVLVAARLAKEAKPGKEWTVRRVNLDRTDRDVAQAIAERIRKRDQSRPDPQRVGLGRSTGARPIRRSRGSTPPPGQGSLFD